jgi:hypothetical protein
MTATVEQTDALQQFPRAASSVRRMSGEFERKQNIFFGRERRDQVIRLKHKADLAPAQQRQVVLFQAGDVLAIQHDAS